MRAVTAARARSIRAGLSADHAVAVPGGRLRTAPPARACARAELNRQLVLEVERVLRGHRVSA